MIKKLYNNLYAHSPVPVKNLLKKTVYTLQGRPRVNPCPLPLAKRFPDGYKGALIISADFEQAWAFARSAGSDAVGLSQRAEKNFPFLLQIFEENNLPVTWATVGHLFLDSCQKGDHDHLPSIKHNTHHWHFTSGSWFDIDPYSNVTSDPAWYAPHLIEQIMAARVKHEIGCHTFSHIDCSEAVCSPHAFAAELEECIKLARQHNLQLRSFVYPGNHIGHLNILADKGFTCYRQSRDYELYYPQADRYGLFNLPPSAFWEDNELGWSTEYTVKFFNRLMIRAIETGSVCHFWFHPTLQDSFLYNILPIICKEAGKLNEQGLLWAATMGELTDFARDSWKQYGR